MRHARVRRGDESAACSSSSTASFPTSAARNGSRAWSGAAKAKELIFTAGQIDADEALRIGLTQQLVPDAELESTAGELAATIAAQPPLAVEGAKRAVNVAGTVPTREGLRIEAEGQAVCLRSDDMKEALAAFVEQRPPSYQRR